MKSVIATAGLFAIANAYQPLNFHYRRQNDSYPVPAPAPVSSEAPIPVVVSSEAPQGFTTLTVEVTEVATVTSCKPTITNCPAVSNALPDSDLEVVVVTNVVVLTETVCPITEAESISSAVVKEHETGSLPGSTRTAPASTSALPTIPVPYPDVPLSTAPAVPVTTSAALPVPGEEYVTDVEDVETTATLTLTLGRGESATVVESVITTTFQTTVVKTITACPGGCDGGDKPATPTGNYPVPGGSEGESEDDFTTTTTATTTGTKTVTVQPSKTAEDSSPEASSPVGAEGGVPGSGSGECPSAVTVTLPASTVYVTIGGQQPTAVAESGNNGGNNGGSSDSGNSPIGGDDDEEDVDEDDCPAEDEDDEDVDEDDCDAEDEDDVVVVSQTVTVEPVPYPTGANNGTVPSGVPAPTGAPVPTSAPAYPIYRRFSNAN